MPAEEENQQAEAGNQGCQGGGDAPDQPDPVAGVPPPGAPPFQIRLVDQTGASTDVRAPVHGAMSIGQPSLPSGETNADVPENVENQRVPDQDRKDHHKGLDGGTNTGMPSHTAGRTTCRVAEVSARDICSERDPTFPEGDSVTHQEAAFPETCEGDSRRVEAWTTIPVFRTLGPARSSRSIPGEAV